MDLFDTWFGSFLLPNTFILDFLHTRGDDLFRLVAPFLPHFGRFCLAIFHLIRTFLYLRKRLCPISGGEWNSISQQHLQTDLVFAPKTNVTRLPYAQTEHSD